MADKKKKKKIYAHPEKPSDQVEKQKSAIARGMASNKKARAAAVKAKPKNPTPQQQQQEKERRGGLREYFRGVVIETKKVVWPTRKELVSYTIVVFIACAFFAVFLWGADSGFLAIIREVFNINLGDYGADIAGLDVGESGLDLSDLGLVDLTQDGIDLSDYGIEAE